MFLNLTNKREFIPLQGTLLTGYSHHVRNRALSINVVHQKLVGCAMEKMTGDGSGFRGSYGCTQLFCYCGLLSPVYSGMAIVHL